MLDFGKEVRMVRSWHCGCLWIPGCPRPAWTQGLGAPVEGVEWDDLSGPSNPNQSGILWPGTENAFMVTDCNSHPAGITEPSLPSFAKAKHRDPTKCRSWRCNNLPCLLRKNHHYHSSPAFLRQSEQICIGIEHEGTLMRQRSANQPQKSDFCAD